MPTYINSNSIMALVGFIQLLLTIYFFVKQKNISKMQMLLTQRQLFPELYQEMKGMHIINTYAPNWNHVIEVANKLEFMAICYEGGLIDAQLIERVYSKTFVFQWERIGMCSPKDANDNGGRTGKDIQNDNPAASQLYEKLKANQISTNKPAALNVSGV